MDLISVTLALVVTERVPNMHFLRQLEKPRPIGYLNSQA